MEEQALTLQDEAAKADALSKKAEQVAREANTIATGDLVTAKHSEALAMQTLAAAQVASSGGSVVATWLAKTEQPDAKEAADKLEAPALGCCPHCGGDVEVELTEEEKACWFKPKTTPDLSHNVLGSAFGNFSIPSKDEGFDAVSFEWQNEVKSKEYLKTWVLKRKLESRIENLQPGEAFKTDHAAFVKSLKEWQAKAKRSEEHTSEIQSP